MERPFNYEHANHEQTIDNANDKLKAVLRNRVAEARSRLSDDDEPLTDDERRILLLNITRWERKIAQLDRGDA